jgi:DNA-directed RNA polymerase II subunit RPB1
MHKIKLSEILVVLRSGNISEAKRMYQLCQTSYDKAHQMSRLIIRENDPELYAFAEQAKLLQLTPVLCDEVAGTNLTMFKRCINTAVKQHKLVAKCVTKNAACVAANNGLIDILQYLFDNQCQIDWDASVAAIKTDQLEVYQWLEGHVPGRVYHSFEFRDGSRTFLIQQYLYQKGYRPTAHDFRRAVAGGDHFYAQWLLEIDCPGAYEYVPEPTTDQMIRIMVHSLTNEDFRWLINVVKNERLPDFEITADTNFFKCLPSFIQYLIDNHCSTKYLFKYLGQHSVWILDQCFIRIAQTIKVNDTIPVSVSPEPAPISPEITPASPEPAPISPEITPVSVSPKLAPISPEIAPTSPELAPITSEIIPVSVSPELAPISPEIAPTSPEIAPTSPEIAPISPEIAPISPEITITVAELTPISPELTPISPELTPISPELAYISPELAPVSPELAPVSVEVVMVDFIKYAEPDLVQLSNIYLYLLPLGQRHVVEYIEHYLTETSNWKWIFLAELRQSAELLIDPLWEKYKDKIDVLMDPERCVEWVALKERNPTKNQCYSFIGSTLGW